MPTYQYECEACGHGFEELQTMMDARLTKCPKCAKKKLVRLIGSGAGMIFKGTGFYETDYKKKTVPTAESKPASPANGSESKASTVAAPAKSEGSCGSGCGCHPKG